MVGSLEMSFSSYMRVLEINFFWKIAIILRVLSAEQVYTQLSFLVHLRTQLFVALRFGIDLVQSHKGNKFRCLEVLESEFPNAIKHQVSFAEIGRTSPPPQFQLFHYAGSTEGSFFQSVSNVTKKLKINQYYFNSLKPR